MARFLGIDIGDHAMRGVLVRSALRKLEVERYVEIPLASAPDAAERSQELASAGSALLRALPAPPDVVVASVPGEEISLRVVELPAAARKRIAEILPFELEAMLPYDPRDAVLDHQPIDNVGGTLRVLAASAQRKPVVDLLQELQKAGLEPRELAAGAASLDGLANLLPELKSAGPLLIVEFGDRRTDVCLMQSGHCVGARTIGLGIEDMPAAADSAQREFARTLASFRTTGLAAPEAVYLGGVGAAAEGAAAWLERTLGSPVRALPLPAASEGATQAGPAFSKAAALAARGAAGGHRINLRTGEFATTHARGQLVDHLNLIATCVVLIVLTAMFALKAREKMLEEEGRALQAELATATKDVFDRSISDPAQAEALITNPKASDPLPRFDAYDAMAALSGSIAPEITHDVRRLSIEVADEKRAGRMELQGALDSLTARDEVVNRLQQHTCFHEIELGRTTPAGTADRINYQIEAMLQCPGEAPPGSKQSKPKQEID
jgi:general secretion pathway protein L